MNSTWDNAKAEINVQKHGVDFADAAVALEDENALTVQDSAYDEYRFKTLCRGPSTNVLLVVHAEQDMHTIRIISARLATRPERSQYFGGDYHD